jgi:hypothetical protein
MFAATPGAMKPVQHARHSTLSASTSRLPAFLAAGTVAVSLTGCTVIEGIFKAGVWVGVATVVGVVALLIWGVTAIFR